MKKKINLKKMATWLAASLALMGVLLFGNLHVTTNNSFEVVYSQAHDRGPNYEGEPAGVRVYASPHIKWQEASGFGKGAGWVLWFLIPVVGYWIGSDKYLGNKSTATLKTAPNSGEWKKWMIWVPVLLCAIAWFAAYSASLDQGSMVKKFDDFTREFKISDRQAEKIINEGGSGTNIKDENGLLTQYFKGK